MLPELEAELQQSLVNDGVATREGRETVVGWVWPAVECEWLSRVSERYDCDEQLLRALQGILATKQKFDVGGFRHTVKLTLLSVVEHGQYELVSYVVAALCICCQRLNV